MLLMGAIWVGEFGHLPLDMGHYEGVISQICYLLLVWMLFFLLITPWELFFSSQNIIFILDVRVFVFYHGLILHYFGK